MPAILLLNPNTSTAATALMHVMLQRVLPASLVVRSATARRGVPMMVSEADLRTAADEVLALGLAHAPEVGAIVIGAFGNPGLAALRAAVAVPVVGIGEAAMREAADGGRRRFGVATTTAGLEEAIGHAAQALGLAHCYTGTRVPAGVDARLLAQDPARQLQCLAEMVDACMADGAQAVVIGGGPLAQAAEELAPRCAIPVINPVAAAGRAVAALLQAGAR